MNIEVIKSKRRKKTIQAKLVKDTLTIRLPENMSPEDEQRAIKRIVEQFHKKKIKKQLNKDQYLVKKFNELNSRHFNNTLKVQSIEFVTNQDHRMGSCTPANNTIRISHKLSQMPQWVLDYVIMHEMTHLLHPNHGKNFWKKVNEYKHTERARGFLIAKGMEQDE